MENLTVVDLFCGPGGFSTGFEMAGFKTVYAIDNNAEALETFAANHQIKPLQADLSSFDYSQLPDSTIIIGGPPCTQFSTSKSNKSRNVLDGLLLVQSFLRCIYLKKPRYWIMENVPAIQKYLPEKIPLSFIGIDEPGEFSIPVKAELIASEYGVAQRRKRYLLGNFPVPQITHLEPASRDLFSAKSLPSPRSMREVLRGLPSPSVGNSHPVVLDTNYNFKLATAKLTDHFYDTRFDAMELLSIKNAKTAHPYMGKMAWPDNIDRPARTVVATQLGRETLVIETNEGDFRRATVRECASFQSFPITYQFFGRSYSSKYRQVGDAVPPLLAYALAAEIRRENKLKIRKPRFKKIVKLSANQLGEKLVKRNRKKNYKRKFRYMLPAKEVRGMRCELIVKSFSPEEVKVGNVVFNKPVWASELILGEGSKNTQIFVLDKSAYKVILKAMKQNYDYSKKWEDFQKKFRLLMKEYKSGPLVYADYVHESPEKSPLILLEKIKKLVDVYFSKEKFHNTTIDLSCLYDHQSSQRVKLRVGLGCLIGFDLVTRWNQ